MGQRERYVPLLHRLVVLTSGSGQFILVISRNNLTHLPRSFILTCAFFRRESKYDRSASFGDFYRISYVPHKLGEKHEPSQPMAGLQNAQPPSPLPESYACSNMPAELDPRRWHPHGLRWIMAAARVSGGATRYARADVASRWPKGCGKALEDNEEKLWGSLIVGAVLSWLWARGKNRRLAICCTSHPRGGSCGGRS